MPDHDHSSHGHDHGQGAGHGHTHAPANFDRAFAIGVALNLGFVAVEAAYGVIANSLALLADAGHNLSDVAGLLLAWGAAWLSRRAPTATRTYGYGRTSILAALANAVLLLVAIGAIGWEAVRRFASPQPVEGGTVMAVAAIGIAVNTATALLFMRGRKGDINIRGAFLHMAADAGVSAGVVLAGLAIVYTEWLWLDPVVSLAIVVVIAIGTWGLLKDSVAMAIDSVPAGIDRDAVEAHLQALPGVQQLHDLHIWPLSTTSTALTVHLVCADARIDDALTAKIAADLKKRFGIAHATIQFETGEESCHLEPDHVV
ncbi:MAG: cation transporter [Phenylobacterium sp.]|uniref:cation diffusion facilitator family transporter n=1 Tax=Phenylobacterium sp. TaxID=1871053 RepID=UPI0025EEDD84|nr:cation diffusion facilitator family transporter [Phenylobacterium sp.]MBT9470802.1 cation transporter [Phenylobacterium sp.]